MKVNWAKKLYWLPQEDEFTKFITTLTTWFLLKGKYDLISVSWHRSLYHTERPYLSLWHLFLHGSRLDNDHRSFVHHVDILLLVIQPGHQFIDVVMDILGLGKGILQGCWTVIDLGLKALIVIHNLTWWEEKGLGTITHTIVVWSLQGSQGPVRNVQYHVAALSRFSGKITRLPGTWSMNIYSRNSLKRSIPLSSQPKARKYHAP